MQYNLSGSYAPIASFELLRSAVNVSEGMGVNPFVGNVYSTDVFYSDLAATKRWQDMGVLAVEMESAALYMNAAKAGRNALCMLTISDRPLKNESLSSKERETGFGKMAQIALNAVIS